MISADDMHIGMAVDAVMTRECAHSRDTEATMGLKFAVMMHMGVTNHIAMLACVEGSEYRDFDRMLVCARAMADDPECQPTLSRIAGRVHEVLAEAILMGAI